MNRLTTNKSVDEMSMYELIYNSCYVKDGKAMYEDFETVRDARDFARNLYKSYLGEELPTDIFSFDDRMIDELQYEPEVHLSGLIALFYRNLWAMADLREALKAYEDKQEQGLLIELSPIEVLELQDTARALFDNWNNTTGAIPNGTSWYYEALGAIEDIVKFAFGAGVLYKVKAEETLEQTEETAHE